MLHIPVAKRSLYKHLFKYQPTPLTAPGFDHHVLVYPRDPVLAIDRGSHVSHPMTKEALDQCTRVGQGPKYCPGRKFSINQSQVGCLRALYGNDVPAVMTECPIVYMTPKYMHVAALSPHHGHIPSGHTRPLKQGIKVLSFWPCFTQIIVICYLPGNFRK